MLDNTESKHLEMFKGYDFLLIKDTELGDNEVNNIVELVEVHSGKIKIMDESDATVEKTRKLCEAQFISQVISNKVTIPGYTVLLEYMIPVVLLLWVFECIKRVRLINPKFYNPDPNAFMSDTFLCIGDGTGSDTEELYGFVRAFGGQYLNDLTKYTTHLLSKDMNNDKSIIASSVSEDAKRDSSVEGGDVIDIKIMSPEWLYDCIKNCRKMNEEGYLLSDVLEGLDSSTTETETETNELNSRTLEGNVIYIHNDFNISKTFRSSLEKFIYKNGGKVLSDFDTSSVTTYLGNFRLGEFYELAVKSEHIVVGNLKWLYYIVYSNAFKFPINLLHFPFPNKPLDEFKDLKICITNYSGDGRSYLSQLIQLLGGTFTKTLTRSNDILIAAKPEGKKFEAASFKWKSDSEKNITIVNHAWLEDCFSRGKFVDYKDQVYRVTASSTPLGATRCNFNDSKDLCKLAKFDDKIEGRDHLQDSIPSSPRESSHLIAHNVWGEISDDRGKCLVRSSSSRENGVKLPRSDLFETTTSLQEATRSRSSRSAKEKAVNLLHSNISQLNEFLEVTKSVRKMKSFMEDLQNESKENKKHSIDELNTSTQKQKRKRTKSPSDSDATHMNAIMTGCEKERQLTKADFNKLKKLGIRIYTDFPEDTEIDTLIAPKILRTAKFLKALAKVNRIIHPKFLYDILSTEVLASNNGKRIDTSMLDLQKYSLDSVISLKAVNDELGTKNVKTNGLKNLLNAKSRGSLFKGLKINFTSNLNGGYELISSILVTHGLEAAHLVKSIKPTNAASLLNNSKSTILIAHKEKDKTLIQNFKKYVKNGIVLEWDWCVKSLFSMELQAFDSYKL